MNPQDSVAQRAPPLAPAPAPASRDEETALRDDVTCPQRPAEQSYHRGMAELGEILRSHEGGGTLPRSEGDSEVELGQVSTEDLIHCWEGVVAAAAGGDLPYGPPLLPLPSRQERELSGLSGLECML